MSFHGVVVTPRPREARVVTMRMPGPSSLTRPLVPAFTWNGFDLCQQEYSPQCRAARRPPQGASACCHPRVCSFNGDAKYLVASSSHTHDCRTRVKRTRRWLLWLRCHSHPCSCSCPPPMSVSCLTANSKCSVLNRASITTRRWFGGSLLVSGLETCDQ